MGKSIDKQVRNLKRSNYFLSRYKMPSFRVFLPGKANRESFARSLKGVAPSLQRTIITKKLRIWTSSPIIMRIIKINEKILKDTADTPRILLSLLPKGNMINIIKFNNGTDYIIMPKKNAPPFSSLVSEESLHPGVISFQVPGNTRTRVRSLTFYDGAHDDGQGTYYDVAKRQYLEGKVKLPPLLTGSKRNLGKLNS